MHGSILARAARTLVWGFLAGSLVACGSPANDPNGGQGGGESGGASGSSAMAGAAGISTAGVSGADEIAGNAGEPNAGAPDEAGAGGGTNTAGTSNGGTGGETNTAGTSNGGASAGDGPVAGGASGGSGSPGGTGGGAVGGSGGGTSPVVCAIGNDHVCPGETRAFSNGVVVSLESSASGPVSVAVAGVGPAAPGGYATVGGTPAVTLGTAGMPLAGLTTVSVSSVTAGSSAPLVLLLVPTGQVSLHSSLAGGVMKYDTTLGGTALIVADSVGSPCVVKEHAGGTFDATSIATLTGVTRLTSSLTITGIAPADLAALGCLAQISGSLS